MFLYSCLKNADLVNPSSSADSSIASIKNSSLGGKHSDNWVDAGIVLMDKLDNSLICICIIYMKLVVF